MNGFFNLENQGCLSSAFPILTLLAAFILPLGSPLALQIRDLAFGNLTDLVFFVRM